MNKKFLKNFLVEKFDGFNIICIEYSKNLRKKIKPININYKPIRQPKKKMCATQQQIFQKLIEAPIARERKIK